MIINNHKNLTLFSLSSFLTNDDESKDVIVLSLFNVDNVVSPDALAFVVVVKNTPDYFSSFLFFF